MLSYSGPSSFEINVSMIRISLYRIIKIIHIVIINDYFSNVLLAYFFGSGKGFGVFTWSSCKIKLTGKTESAYISKDTPMIPYLNVSFAIENLREEAEAAEERVRN